MVHSDYREWRPGFEPISESDVASLLQHIRNHNGTVSDEDRKDTTNFGPLSLSIIADLKASKSADVEFLSREIYSSGTRFLYEVIQNADDNNYTKLAGSDEKPQLSITLTRDKLIFENNEDGFTRANVQAISQTRKSTKAKTMDQEQIGEKGIGFKAVFAVADKVHIQSGIYSFSFHYERGEDEGALGMIAPMKEPNEDMPTSGTRITLTDLYDIDFNDLRDQLEQLPDPLLLLLRRLSSLVIRIDDGQQVTEISRSRKVIDGSGFTEITQSLSVRRKEEATQPTEKPTQLKHIYYVRTRLFDDLPNDPARKVGDTGQFINHAKVVLAFPLDEVMVPRIDNQFSYAFLPMRKFGFSFVIQSDFITQANREDVRYSSKRNKALLDRVGQVFCDAVEEMCKHKSLRYTWMRFLPTTISSDFWSSLESFICRDLRTRSILEPFPNVTSFAESQELMPLCTPKSLHIIPSWFLDNDRKPLLPEGNEIKYLSLAYSAEDRSKLRPIKVEELDWSNIPDLFAADLDRSDCRWHSLDYSKNWQKQISELFISICSSATDRSRLRSLRMVKLLNGEWIAPTFQEHLFMPTSGRAEVPDDVGLKIIDPASIKTPSRASLMEKLGIEHASPSMVIGKIESMHSTSSPYKTVKKGIIHFQYLFWHGPEILSQSLRTKLQFIQEEGNFFTHLYQDTFLSVPKDDLGPGKLFRKMSKGLVQANGFSQACFLHHLWLEDDMIDLLVVNPRGQTWEEWLVTALGLLKSPRLLKKQLQSSSRNRPPNEEVSEEFRYLMKHRPDVIVPLIHRHQKNWMPIAPRFVLEFKATKVLCQDNFLAPLSETILPTTKLRSLASSFGVLKLPFILLQDDVVQDTKLHEWAFLNQFKVITDECLDFYVKCVVEVISASEGQPVADIFKIYTKIQGIWKHEDKGRLENQLNDYKWIYIPATNSTDAKWVNTRDCRWKGPSWLTCKYVLKYIEQYKGLDFLLHTYIQLPDATAEDFIEQLKEMKAKPSSLADIDTVREIYELLWSMYSGDTGGWLRDQFESYALVWTKSVWLPPSECVWAPNKTKIEGKVSIQDIYGSKAPLKDMFISAKGLQIPSPSLEMHLDSLMSLEKTHGSKADIVNVMEHIAALKRPEGSLKPKLKGLNIFPIKQGSKEIRASLSVEFAVVDNSIYRGCFEEKIYILDFDDYEFWRTKDFLTACGLSNRFMSECSIEETSAADAVPDKVKTNELRLKAYAFLRYAKHCRSTRIQESHRELYEHLQNMSVFKSNDITRFRSITQSSETHRVPLDKVGIHIDEGESLKIYLPTDPEDLERCWPMDVILKLKKWLGVSDRTLDDILTQILNRTNLKILDEDLQKKGIIIVDGIERPQDNVNITIPAEDFRSTSPYSSAGPWSNTAATSYRSRASYQPHSQYEDRNHVNITIPAEEDFRSTASYGSGGSWSNTAATSYWSRTSYQPHSQYDDRSHIDIYSEILEEVIQAARSKPLHDRHDPLQPRRVTSNNQRLQSAFGPAFINGSRNMQRDRKVGAAGELFIFEFLKKLQLPEFDLENWRSTIRHEVRTHPSYAGLVTFNGRETSDIVYQDTEGSLTNILCSLRYLDSVVWSGKTPEYLIEVKTTTEACEDPFYVSAAQYKIMEDMRITEDQATSRVYLVMRVFNLGQAETIDHRIYLDPWSAKERGDLQFSTNNWKVEPTRSADRQGTAGSNGAQNVHGNSRTSNSSTQSSDTPVPRDAPDQYPPRTILTPYAVTSEIENVGRPPSEFQSITHMPAYQKWSFEEIRLHDYSWVLHTSPGSEEDSDSEEEL